jgi:hypothetical protein
MREKARIVSCWIAGATLVLGCTAQEGTTPDTEQPLPIMEQAAEEQTPAAAGDQVTGEPAAGDQVADDEAAEGPIADDGAIDGAIDDEAVCDGALLPPRCAEHGECASDVCDRDALLGRGACVPEASVVYVNSRQLGCATGDGSRANPVCQIRDGVELAIGGGKETVRVYPGSYLNFGMSGGTLRVFGPGDGSALAGEEDITAGFRVSDGARVVLDGVNLGRSVLTGAVCTDSSLRVVRASITGDNNGIRSTNCTLILDRVRVSGGTRAGLTMSGTGTYLISNSYFRSGDLPSVVFDGTSTGIFRFNTVTGGGEITPGGIDCGTTARVIQDSIVSGNFPAEGGAQTVGACTHRRVVVGSADTRTLPGLIKLDPELDAEGRLLDTPRNAACCIDRGARFALGLREDFFGTRRPQGRSNDIGAHELPR